MIIMEQCVFYVIAFCFSTMIELCHVSTADMSHVANMWGRRMVGFSDKFNCNVPVTSACF